MVYSFFNNLEEAQRSVFMVCGEGLILFAALTISTGCDCIIFVQNVLKKVFMQRCVKGL